MSSIVPNFKNPYKCREEDMKPLEDSIRENGIIQPLMVRKDDKADVYEIISGHRRYLAATRLKLTEVPVVVLDITKEEADMSILQNEKYKGDALLQKKFTVDFLTKKQKVNEGEIPQYYVEGSHPAIITAIDFDMVQAEIARRQTLGRAYSGSSIFASKLICGDCGGFYGQKVWHSTDAYRRVIWRCNSKFSGEAKCETPTLAAETIQQMFLKAFNQLMGSCEQVLKACEAMREIVSDCTALDAEIDALNDEIQVVAELVNQCIKENASKEQSQEEYAKKYNRLVKRYEKATDRLKVVTTERESRMQRDRELRIFIGSIEKQPLVLEAWDEELWLTLLETATVHKDNSITFLFKNGTEIAVQA